MKRLGYLLFILIPTVALAGPPEAPYASGARDLPSEPSELNSVALHDPNYTDADMSSIYHKASENVSFQADYILKKIDFLENEKNLLETRYAVLGDFCTPDERASPDDKSDVEKENRYKKCLDRFIRVHSFWLVKAKGSLANNAKVISALNCALYNENGVCLQENPKKLQVNQYEGQTNSPPAPGARMAQTPYFSKYDDLRRQAERSSSSSATAPSDPKQWMDRMASSLEPKLEDFMEFVPAQSPTNTSGSNVVPRRNTDGTFVYNTAAYHRAREIWQNGGRNDILKTFEDKGPDIRKYQLKEKQKFIEQKNPSDRTLQERKRLYDETHDEQVNETNAYIKQKQSNPTLQGQKQSRQVNSSGSATPIGAQGAAPGTLEVNSPLFVPGSSTPASYYRSYAPDAFSRDADSHNRPPSPSEDNDQYLRNQLFY